MVASSKYLLTTQRARYNVITKMAKKLGVFDFDHTIVEDNTDIVVRKLLRTDQIPDKVKNLYRSSGWTVYMQEIFKLLKKYNIPEFTVKNAINKIIPVNAITTLITDMVDKLDFDVIIISDSNSLFIDEWLKSHGMSKYVHSVFTNPAKYDKNGLLRIEMYHVQHECNLSTVNLCKGMIMENFIETQKKAGVNYSQIVYAGDGKNDFCPMLKLNESDWACVRANYACAELVKKSYDKDSEHKIKAQVCYWNSGKDILKCIE